VAVQLADVAAASSEVTATASRSAKVAALSRCLQLAADDRDPATVPVVVAYLSGELPQRRTGLGPASLRGAPTPAAQSSLTVTEVDATFTRCELLVGTGSTTERRRLLHALLARAVADEQRLLVGLVTGDLRQGAAQALVLDAVAATVGLPVASVRRAMTLSGSPAEVAVSALTEGAAGLARFGLEIGRPLSPMLAQSAPNLVDALARTGPAAVEAKLDGVRVQVHRDGGEVRIFTRTLDEVTDRLPDVVEAVRALPCTSAVLDGEVLALAADGRPRPFQVTASRAARRGSPAAEAARTPLTLFLFDALHLDGEDLLDLPGTLRRGALEQLAPLPPRMVLTSRVEVADPVDGRQVEAAQAFVDQTLRQGHEGVVVKSLSAPYAMGRRGAGWVKVKPVHTLDLVVLAAEWGHGRRTGRLSNLHLGARDPDGRFGPAGGFVLLGKTFKGLTDAMLSWQTEHLQRLALPDQESSWVVHVRPELVVEIALDGVQTSPRYPAAVALRFARVVRHRPDRDAAGSDPIEAVLALATQ
jgi:DNA ligase-1